MDLHKFGINAQKLMKRASAQKNRSQGHGTKLVEIIIRI